MPLDRFYLPAPLKLGSEVFLEETELHHLVHVLRCQVGETIELIDGKGSLAKGSICSIDKKRALLRLDALQKQPASPPQILLGVPLLRPSKLEWIVEKGTELGVDSFLFYPSERGENKEPSAHQFQRLTTLCIAAMKQSGRLFLPHLEKLAHFSDLFKKEASIFYGDPHVSSPSLPEELFPALFVTGPESGFSENEYALLKSKGEAILLSEHVLRAETAPITAASLLGWKKILLHSL